MSIRPAPVPLPDPLQYLTIPKEFLPLFILLALFVALLLFLFGFTLGFILRKEKSKK